MRRIGGIVIFLLIIYWSAIAWAQWVTDGAAICTASGTQEFPQVVSDGSGGAIIVWLDRRSGDRDIYAQKITADGLVVWAADGVAVCTASGGQVSHQIISDGSGGAIITWEDYRFGTSPDILAQRINASGSCVWTDNGTGICTARGHQRRPQLTSDNSGGAIITWQDWRWGDSDWNIYAQRVTADGWQRWTGNGVAVCKATEYQEYPQIASDGSGGAIITWIDRRHLEYDIYAQRINANGTRMWTANGEPICEVSRYQAFPQIISDGSGGAIITWNDIVEYNWNVHAQRVGEDGLVLWARNGIPICMAYGEQRYPQITSDGSGGAIIAWKESYPSSRRGVYAQRVGADGSVKWIEDGAAMSIGSIIIMSNFVQYGPQLISDGSGNVIFAGNEYRSGSADIYAQKVDANGLPIWTPTGVAMCTASGEQRYPQLTSDGSGGAIIAWQDERNGDLDIYAMRAYEKAPPMKVYFDIHPGSCPNPLNPKSRGILPAAILGTGEFDISTIDPFSIKLADLSPKRWSVEDVAAPLSSAEECVCTETGPDGINDLVLKFDVPELVKNFGVLMPGEIIPLTVTGSLNDNTEFEGYDCVVIVGGIPQRHSEPRYQLTVSLDSYPNDLIQHINYYLPERSNVEIAIFDVSGRLVKKFEKLSKSAGAHTVEWDTSGLPSGVYFFQLVAHSHTETRKIILLK